MVLMPFLHLVSTTLPKNSNDDPVDDVQSNLASSLQLLDAMVEKGSKRLSSYRREVLFTVILTYLPIDEDHPTNPLVSYGIIKLAIEKYLLFYQYSHGISLIFSGGLIDGERQRVKTAQGAVTTFINRVIGNQPIEIWGDGSIIRDYIYISDVAEAVVRAIDYDGEKSVFNIASGRA